MTVVHPLRRAWISTGGTGARNYDEFADDAEITEIIAANPRSALAVEMPHRVPASVGLTFSQALDEAAARLAKDQADGAYRPVDDVVVLYRIAAPERLDEAAYGVFAMVETSQISTTADEPGLVIRNEDVFIEKVRERVALAEATQHLLSPVLLVQTGCGDELHAALVEAVAQAGEPDVTDVDHVGRTHAVWVLPAASAAATRITELAGGGELVVADGNHRSLAAQIGELPRFLAVITTADSVAIQPYHRLVDQSPLDVTAIVTRLRELGADVSPVPRGALSVPDRGEIIVYGRPSRTAGEGYRVGLAGLIEPGTDQVGRMDHAVVERVLLSAVLGLEPGDKRITYVGGDYPPEWLVSEVDTDRADIAIMIAPVAVVDFVEVNLARHKLPRKSTWFTPKARGGLVLADLRAIDEGRE